MQKVFEQSVPGYSLVEQHSGRINGRDAAWFVWKGKTNDAPGEIQNMMLIETDGRTLYQVGCMALTAQYDAFKPTFQGVSGSFKVTH